MDPVLSFTAIKTLVLAIKITIQGIRHVEEITRGLGEEIGAFAFALTVLESELRKSALLHQTYDWWDETKINELLHNATKTFSRLQAIFSDINRRRTALQSMREFYRSTQYDDEIKHLRLRITTYTTALNVPMILLAMHGNQNPPSQETPGLGDCVLGDRIACLELSLGQFFKDIPKYFTTNVASSTNLTPDEEPTTQQDSEDLLEIAYSLISCASSITSITGSFRSAASTVRRDDDSDSNNSPLILEHSSSLSVTGIPLSPQRRGIVVDWLQNSPQLVPTPISISPEEHELAELSDNAASSIAQSMVTPPSTVIGDGCSGFNLEAEIKKHKRRRALEAKEKKAKAREEQVKARQDLMTKSHILMSKWKFQEAIPDLKDCLVKTNDLINDSLHPHECRFLHSERIHLKISLADALRNTHEFWQASETSTTDLRDVLISPYCEQNERLRACHVLADYLLHHSNCVHDLLEAKSLCATSIKIRASIFGPAHAMTFDSINLMSAICEALSDNDAELIRDMVPANYPNPGLTTSRWAIVGKLRYIVKPFSREQFRGTRLTGIAWQFENPPAGLSVSECWWDITLENPRDFPVMQATVDRCMGDIKRCFRVGDEIEVIGQTKRYCHVRNMRTKQVIQLSLEELWDLIGH